MNTEKMSKIYRDLWIERERNKLIMSIISIIRMKITFQTGHGYTYLSENTCEIDCNILSNTFRNHSRGPPTPERRNQTSSS